MEYDGTVVPSHPVVLREVTGTSEVPLILTALYMNQVQYSPDRPVKTRSPLHPYRTVPTRETYVHPVKFREIVITPG